MYKKLVIVSDTAIFIDSNRVYGFNAVVNEINHFEHLFDEIVWIGFNRKDLINNKSMQKLTSLKVKIVLLNNIGGKNLFGILKIIFNYPIMVFIIFKHIWTANVIHTRAPSHPAFIAILISFVLQKKIWWHKFAGNWDTTTLPFFYKLQRNILNHAKHSKVTINGFWDNQPQHCLSFENPCLDENDIVKGKDIANNKTFNKPFSFVFVGRLETAKGVDRIINALKELPIDFIDKIHFIGDGNKTDFYKKETLFLGNKVVFHGFLEKEKVHQIFAQTHFILLPSSSEGFPKVVAEAGCYGTIPIVSNVGSIPHYINKTNGFLWDINDVIPFKNSISNAINLNANDLEIKSKNCLLFAEKFTFANYINKLNLQILNK